MPHDSYLWLKALHIIALISWMAGMLYLPRLFVYHSRVAPGSEASEMLNHDEAAAPHHQPRHDRHLDFGLMAGILNSNAFDGRANGYWLHAKLGLVLLMQIVHAMLARYRRQFFADVDL